DGAQDALADARARPREAGRSGIGAAHELGGGHAMAVGKDMHVAGLGGLELVAAGGLEGCGDGVGARRHRGASRFPRAASTCTRSAASAAAMFVRVTFCKPDQAGMLLTSSTSVRPSAS